MWFFLVIALTIAAVSTVGAFSRIGALLSNENLTVNISPKFLDSTVKVGANAVDMQISAASVTVPSLPEELIGLAVVEVVLGLLTLWVIVGSLSFFGGRVYRGEIFGRASTVAVAIAGFTALVGTGVSAMMRSAFSNSVMFELGADGPQWAAEVDVTGFWLGAFALGIVLTAMTVGARMQRDTEGLV
jgi:hypothetical protein